MKMRKYHIATSLGLYILVSYWAGGGEIIDYKDALESPYVSKSYCESARRDSQKMRREGNFDKKRRWKCVPL